MFTLIRFDTRSTSLLLTITPKKKLTKITLTIGVKLNERSINMLSVTLTHFRLRIQVHSVLKN